MTEAWTAQELREHVGQVGVVPELVVPVRVTGADLDPPTAQDLARTRKPVVAVGAVVILAFVVTAALRQALRDCFQHQRCAIRRLGGGPVRHGAAHTDRSGPQRAQEMAGRCRRRPTAGADRGSGVVGSRAGKGPGDPLERQEWPHRATADVRRCFRRWIELRLADRSAIALLLGRSARMQIADAISGVGPGGG